MRVGITQLSLEEGLEVPPRTPLCVSWTSSRVDQLRLWRSEAPDALEFPDAGLVRLRFGASFETEAEGLRQCWIDKNEAWSEPFYGYPTPTILAVGEGSSTSMSGVSAAAVVVPGDVFKLWVYHTASRPLLLRGAHATWFEAESLPFDLELDVPGGSEAEAKEALS